MSQQLNLYNPLFEKKQKAFSVVAMGQCLGFIAIAMLVFYVYAAFQTRATERVASQMRGQLSAQRDQLAKLAQASGQPRSKALEAEVVRLDLEVQARKDTLRALGKGELGNTGGFSEFFAAFGRQALPGVWLTDITIADSGNELTVKGRALRAELMPAFLRALNNEPVMRGRKVTEMKLTAKTAPVADKAVVSKPRAEPEAFVEFSVVAPLQMAEAPVSTPKSGTP
ncbi:MAG TPA: PilN domain-containing protein [Polyangiaceae bacterium]